MNPLLVRKQCNTLSKRKKNPNQFQKNIFYFAKLSSVRAWAPKGNRSYRLDSKVQSLQVVTEEIWPLVLLMFMRIERVILQVPMYFLTWLKMFTFLRLVQCLQVALGSCPSIVKLPHRQPFHPSAHHPHKAMGSAEYLHVTLTFNFYEMTLLLLLFYALWANTLWQYLKEMQKLK